MAGSNRPVDGSLPSILVIEEVAAAEGTAETDLPPLNDATDPDALDALYAPRLDGRDRVGCRVTFAYCGYTVTVDERGAVSLAD